MEVPLVCSKVESYNITYWPAATQLFYWLRNFEFCSCWHTILILESTLPTYKKFAVKQHAILYQRQQPHTSCVSHVSCLHIFSCA